MLRLSTFGGCVLAKDGSPLDAFSSQRKTFGLLALLAVAGHRGVPRSILLTHLWPESDEERARTSLKQLAHGLRTRLGSDILLGGADLRLNPERITADVTEFRAAVAVGDHDRAVALYAGSFLDGFFLRDSDGFERWVAQHREAFAREFARSLQSLAERAGAAGDPVTAVAYWRRLAEAEPLSAQGAVGLIRALDAAGERAEALQYARIYDQLVRAEVGGPPDPSVDALAAQLRVAPAAAVLAGAPILAGTIVPDAKAGLSELTPAAATAAVLTGHANRRRRRLIPISVGVLLVAGLGLGQAALRDASAAKGEMSGRIVVAPFENLTGDSSLRHVSRITADWLSRAMTELDSVDVVSSAAVAIVLRDFDGSPVEARQLLGSATRAHRVVTGGYARRAPDSLVVHANVVDARDGRVIWTLDPAVAPVGDPTVAIQALREQLLGALVSERTPRARVRGIRPPRYSAYVEYLAAAERYERYQDMEGARPHLELAVALDSTFASAWGMLVGSYVNRGQFDEAVRVVERMERMRHLFSPTDLEVLDLARAESRLDAEAHLRAAQRLAARDSNPVMLYLIGWNGTSLLRPDLAVPALERADSLMLLNGWRPQVVALAEAYHQAGDHRRELETILRGRRLFPEDVQFPGRQLRALAGLGQADPAVVLTDTILRGMPESVGFRVWPIIIASEEFRVHGDSLTGVRLLAMLREWFLSHPSAAHHPVRDLMEGIVRYRSGDFPAAAGSLERAVRDTTSLDAAGYLALTYVALGRRERAARMADSLGALQRRWLFGAHFRWRGAILGALGERELALEMLRQAKREHHRLTLWHVNPGLAPLRGYGPFEDLIRTRRH